MCHHIRGNQRQKIALVFLAVYRFIKQFLPGRRTSGPHIMACTDKIAAKRFCLLSRMPNLNCLLQNAQGLGVLPLEYSLPNWAMICASNCSRTSSTENWIPNCRGHCLCILHSSGIGLKPLRYHQHMNAVYLITGLL